MPERAADEGGLQHSERSMSSIKRPLPRNNAGSSRRLILPADTFGFYCHQHRHILIPIGEKSSDQYGGFAATSYIRKDGKDEAEQDDGKSVISMDH